MKFSISETEWWPVFGLNEDKAGKYHLSAEEYADYEAAYERFQEWQIKIAQLKPEGWIAPTKEEIEQERALDAYFNSVEYKISLQTP